MNLLYLTSASIDTKNIEERLGHLVGKTAIVEPSTLLTLGPAPSWPREEILLWKDGETSIVPVTEHLHSKTLSEGSYNDLIQMQLDVHVPDLPIPNDQGLRAHAMNWEIFNGAQSRHVNLSRASTVSIEWPSSAVMLDSLGASRGIEFTVSEPGRAAVALLAAFEGIWELDYLAHEPLLNLLEELASRSGMSWAKKRVREGSGGGARRLIVG